jgi:hypothetical protein
MHAKALRRMPETSAYLSKHLETMEQWRKRKIIWAIRVLKERGEFITPFKIGATASIDSHIALELHGFMLECLAKDE